MKNGGHLEAVGGISWVFLCRTKVLFVNRDCLLHPVYVYIIYNFEYLMIYNFIFVIWHYFWPPEEEKQIIGRQPKKQKIL